MNVRNKGLVVVIGCGHSRIINTIRHSQDLTGVRDIYAVVGGFHLTGGLFEGIIPATVKDLRKINPRYVIAVLESNHGLTCGRHGWLAQQCDSVQKKLLRITISSDRLFPSFRRKPE